MARPRALQHWEVGLGAATLFAHSTYASGSPVAKVNAPSLHSHAVSHGHDHAVHAAYANEPARTNRTGADTLLIYVMPNTNE